MSVENALDYVAGYCIGLDMTVRGPEERSMRKSIDTYTVLGPWLTTADEIGDPHSLQLVLTVNGQPRQNNNTGNLLIKVRELIAWASTYVVQMTQFHRYDIAAKMSQGSPVATDRLNMITGAFHAQGMDLQKAHDAALSVMDGEIGVQAYTMAFNNVQIAIMILFAAAIPILFLMKRRSGGDTSVAAH